MIYIFYRNNLAFQIKKLIYRGCANKNIGDAFLLVWKLKSELSETNSASRNRSFMQSISSLNEEEEIFKDKSKLITEKSNELDCYKSLFVNIKDSQSKIFKDTMHSKAFERSFYQPVMTEIMKVNSIMAESSLLSFIKIVYEINTQPKIKK